MLNKELIEELIETQKQYTKKQERARAFSLKLELGGKLKVINTVIECESVEDMKEKLNILMAEAKEEIAKQVKAMSDVDVKCRYFGMKEEIESVLNRL